MASSPRNRLTRPIFIMAAPRSGSTLLFETLTVAESLGSLGDEGHAIVERHPPLRPAPGGVDSNRLTAEQASPAVAAAIREDLQRGMRDHRGRPPAPGQRLRLIEKTPKNILRIPFFDAIFPDALFVYLYRDPKENISSIMDGWQSGRFVTYRDKRGRNGPWSFLLPPGWRDMLDAPLVDVAAFQWRTAHEHALRDLGTLARERWTTVSYTEFLEDTSGVVRRLCDFMQIPMDERLARHCAGTLPPSRYSLTRPVKDKWRKNAAALAGVLPGLAATIRAINAVAGQSPPLDEDVEIPLDPPPPGPAAAQPAAETVAPAVAPDATIRRNEPCPCGSGRRYKACHGSL